MHLRKSLIVGISAILITLSSTQVARANWYAGNSRYSSYGAKATIYTPSSAPYMASGSQSSWVSLPCCTWVQAGWVFYKGWSNAQRYVEHCVNGICNADYHGVQPWGTSSLYQVNYAQNNSNWNAYIDGVYEGTWGPITSSPIQMQAYSEIQNSTSNQLNTTFNNVSYLSTSFQWYLFDQWNFVADSPYKVQVFGNNYYRTYGP